ncbi:ABC2-like protein [Artemisia annua]|uniref:ABC2-like protein n=1 Tax=Artemisia annua TaxID=35608 RepID=A0A2U1N1K3_ARTAN|nr:ABC2-like protein [Artemisia annua]
MNLHQQKIGTFCTRDDNVFIIDAVCLFTGKRRPQLIMNPQNASSLVDTAVSFSFDAVCLFTGKRRPQLIMYALVLVDAKGIKENCMKLSVGEDLYALFAGILTTRPWNRVIDPAVDHLAIQVNASDLSELQNTNHTERIIGCSIAVGFSFISSAFFGFKPLVPSP